MFGWFRRKKQEEKKINYKSGEAHGVRKPESIPAPPPRRNFPSRSTGVAESQAYANSRTHDPTLQNLAMLGILASGSDSNDDGNRHTSSYNDCSSHSDSGSSYDSGSSSSDCGSSGGDCGGGGGGCD